MKRTGRILNLVNDIDTINPVGSRSDLGSGQRLTTIFNDDREGYGWRVVEFFPMPYSPTNNNPIPMMLTTARPDSFTSDAEFGTWASNEAIYSNSLVAVYDTLAKNSMTYDHSTVKTDHVAVNHLAIMYQEGSIPVYKITLEEYTISDKEEIVFKLKEVSQNVGDRN